MRRYFPLGLLLVVVALLPAIASADSSDYTSSFVSGPFSGYWGRTNVANPSFHPRSQCESTTSGLLPTKPNCTANSGIYGPGDWSLDSYAGSGTAVQFHHYDNGAYYSAVVWNIAPTCTTGSAGQTVFIDLWVNGTWEGWVAFGHLDNVQVSPGQVLSQDQVLGYLKFWDWYAGCWEVNGEAGVHTHIEMWNRNAYACYTNYNWGQYLSYGQIIGWVGRMIYTTIRAPC